MPRPEVPCAGCGKPIRRSVDAPPDGEAMCHPCRRVRQAVCPRRPHNTRPKLPCAICGKLLFKSTTSLPAGQATCRPCRKQRKAEQQQPRPARQRPTCEVCGATYRRSYSKQRTCSRDCGWKIRKRPERKPAERKPKPQPHCLICDKTRTPGERWRSYCSAQCTIDASGMRVNDLYHAAVALRMGGGGWLRLLMRYLAERDGTRCAICRRQIKFDLKSGPRGHKSGLGPSVDHVVPRSRGGSDDPSNLRLTHWRCNFERHAGRTGEAIQLAMIG